MSSGISRLQIDRDVLLFFEDRDKDTFVHGDRHLRRRLRNLVEPFRPNKQKISGFELSFQLLCKALRRTGQTVHVNDFALARRNPDFPVGLCGYLGILQTWKLSNPAVLGPGLYDHPKQAPELLHGRNFRSYIVFCEWMRHMFAGSWNSEQLYLWFGGIDLDDWTDTKQSPKDIDFLVYDKIRWNRDRLVPNLREPILAELTRCGYSFEILRYGQYQHPTYKALLQRSRALLFLCEHETQGMAYQEALASNVPVLAWDQETWLDPNRPQWEASPVPASSVPYFSPACGERFREVADFPATLARFMERRETYAPRAWVEEHLSFVESARLYMRAYRAAAESPAPAETKTVR
jgi:hypothetical protein